MTTSIYDIYNKAVASDTRWSFEIELSDGNKYLVYSDDTGFEKITQKGGYAIIFAGYGPLIGDWKKWFDDGMDFQKAPPLSVQLLDKQQMVFFIIVDMYKNEPIYSVASQKKVLLDESETIRCYTNPHGRKIVYVSIGSGSEFAATEWNRSRCHQNAITYASGQDYFTSNICRQIDLDSEKQNFETDSTQYKTIHNALFRRGFMINRSKQDASSVGDSIHSNLMGGEVKRMIRNGKAYASAPAPELEGFEWTEDARQELYDALQLVAKGREGRMRKV